MNKLKILLLELTCVLLLVGGILSAPSAAASSSAALETVTLQLKWKHQFQFAGYYAAIEKGYYRDVGLQVVLREGSPQINVTAELTAGRVEYGVAMPEVVLERQAGKKVVVLGAFFQHSPEALFLRKDSAISNPQALVGRNVMLLPKGNVEIRAMLLSEGIDAANINIMPHSWDINDLINGKVDAAAGYLTDRPFILQERGVEYSVIRPLTYGVDFYGDCLFSTEKEISDHPQRVKNFLAASIKGWEYAMRHPDEMADLILKKYSSRLSKKALLYEADAMQELMQPDFIEIGHMNPGRWKHIADTFVKLGMLMPNYSLQGFLYDPDTGADYAKIMRIVWGMLFVVVGITVAGAILLLFNQRLRREVAKRTGELDRERKFTDTILKTMPGAFYVFEDGERLIRWNEKFQADSGFNDEQMLGRNPLDWFDGEERAKVLKGLGNVFEKGEASVEANITFKNNVVPYYFTGNLLVVDDKKYMIGMGIDLTVRRQLEEQLRQAQKMESIGRLAGGVAHDFNNILTTILGYSELLLSGMSRNDKNWEEIDIIHSAGEKASALTRQLLAFSRKQILEKKVVQINTIIDELLKILGKMLGEDIVIKAYLQAVDGVLEADPGQIEQILMNLAVNARDAMPQGGEIIIETNDVVFDGDYGGAHVDIKPGAYVMLAVTDTGEGMGKDVMEHIFDPFFTTKEKHKGTGLGLATVYGIVKQHNGQIYAYSEVGKGTTLRIYFPATEKKLAVEDRDERAVFLPPGHETVMVVDDEASIRRLVMATLEPLGYKCLEAACGEDAIEVVNGYSDDIDLLLTDVVMPGMSGRAMAEKVCVARPNMKVVFMSGYSENVITHHGVLDSGINYIAKPITPFSLARKIRSVLG